MNTVSIVKLALIDLENIYYNLIILFNSPQYIILGILTGCVFTRGKYFGRGCYAQELTSLERGCLLCQFLAKRFFIGCQELCSFVLPINVFCS